MYLSSYSFLEPEEPFYLYYPSWLNVWESHSYNTALKATGANGWRFKRFGTRNDVYTREITRRPDHIPYINALDKVSDAALHSLSAKERMLLLKSRTAFIYIDSWGESGVFEYNISSLNLSTIDTLPKSLIKKFSINDVTCKIRGENNSLFQAMAMAQDYLGWDVFDFVVICGGYRAVPLLAFTAESMKQRKEKKKYHHIPGVNLSIERVGCFVFSKREGGFKVHCSPYTYADVNEISLPGHKNINDVDCIAYAGGINKSITASENVIDLIARYGCSGCVTPALTWQYINQYALHNGCIRTIIPGIASGYAYFDTWYQ
ncbi:ATP-binding protein [Klebsiella aerogenes]|uniref:ATP-binding protein n=1 Tax=Klebsiella aerogenes TaxID=548 RepID=UPI00190E95AC|nr:ATP-binding protein [Klebsiella aerogenes]MBK0697740.1 ATP-binding protein [Klebsiella aerogenes]